MKVGIWDYKSGTSGSLDLGAIAGSGDPIRVQTITAIAGTSDATVQVDNRDTATIPAGQGLVLSPGGTITNSVIVFTGTASYVVEFVTNNMRGYTEGNI